MSERDVLREAAPRGWRIGRYTFCVSGWQQWREWFTPDWNWRNFTLFNAAIEAGEYKGRYVEVSVGLLGFCAEVEVYDWVDRAEALSPIERRAQDYEERGGAAPKESP